MSALEAARMGDVIGHTSAWAGLIAGALAGLAIGALILFVVVTGGAGAILIAAAIAGAVSLTAGLALGGLQVGEMTPGSPCGAITTGSPNTIIEGQHAARAALDLIAHGAKLVAQGSSTVFVNARHLGRRSEKAQCGGVITETCHHTYIGGDTVTLVPIDQEVPSWLVNGLKWTALIAGGAALLLTGIGAVAALGWAAGLGMTALGAAGSLGLGYAGKQIGTAIGGIFGPRGAVIGGIIGETGGSLLGGLGAARLGEVFFADPVVLEEPPVDVVARDEVVGPNEPLARSGVSDETTALARTEGTSDAHVAARQDVARDWYQRTQPDLTEAQMQSHLDGIDLNKPVSVVTIPPGGGGPEGNSLYSWNAPGAKGPGQYFSNDPTTQPTELGINPKTIRMNDDGTYRGGARTQVEYQFDPNSPQQALQSTAAPIRDTWSGGEGYDTTGGGTQLQIPRASQTAGNLQPVGGSGPGHP